MLCRAGHDRDVRHVLPGPVLRIALLRRGPDHDLAGGSAWGAVALAGHRPPALGAAGQPAPRHRWRAVCIAKCRYRRVRHRLPQPRHSAAGTAVRGDAFQLLPSAGLRLLHRHDVHQARRAAGEALVTIRQLGPWIAGAALIVLPFVYREPYHLHLIILILIWSFAYTSWSMMGRFNLVSLGHGGFMGVGAYVTALLWNPLDLSPWIGIPISMVAAGILALVVAYPCFRFRITGHYFVLVTLALSGIVLQVITATRDYTGGSLGYTPNRARSGSGLMALQFDDKTTWYLIALGVWVVGLLVWRWVDRSMSRYAMEAISEDEDAAAAAGVNVTAEKLKITLISALMTALAGALYCQYQMFISPDTVSGIAGSLPMVFAVIVGGLYVSLGPTIGAIITILLAETLRIGFGTRAVGWDNLVYGVLLVLFIIFLPKGILGSILERLKFRKA